MFHTPAATALDVVVPRLVIAVQASLAAFVLLALACHQLELGLGWTGQVLALLLMVTTGLAVAGYRHRRTT